MEPKTEPPFNALVHSPKFATELPCPLYSHIDLPAAGPPQGSGVWARCCLAGSQRGCSGWVCSGSAALLGAPSTHSHFAELFCKQSLSISHPGMMAQRSTSYSSHTHPLAGSGQLCVPPLSLARPSKFCESHQEGQLYSQDKTSAQRDLGTCLQRQHCRDPQPGQSILAGWN